MPNFYQPNALALRGLQRLLSRLASDSATTLAIPLCHSSLFLGGEDLCPFSNAYCENGRNLGPLSAATGTTQCRLDRLGRQWVHERTTDYNIGQSGLIRRQIRRRRRRANDAQRLGSSMPWKNQ